MNALLLDRPGRALELANAPAHPCPDPDYAAPSRALDRSTKVG